MYRYTLFDERVVNCDEWRVVVITVICDVVGDVVGLEGGRWW